ncbi:hypothetical protein BJY04DRAFT_225013 [Aspergillus karnatakaensis]|uniref:uncharacterized protein n=1 Tax=Aspergillus karnatakaensis TaxID=1810916 RepID=UPI003CCDFD22
MSATSTTCLTPPISNPLSTLLFPPRAPPPLQEQPLPLIFNLPECLIRDIFDLLPLAGKACLSLTCKLYSALFIKILKHPELRSPLLGDLVKPTVNVFTANAPRNQLLMLLQDNHWAFCAACLKLHPREEFTPQSVLRLPDMERNCMPYAGVVNLCECISLTPRAKVAMVRFLCQRQKSRDKTTPVQTWGKFEVKSTGNKRPLLQHECTVADRDDVKIDFCVQIDVQDSQMLIARLTYNIYDDRERTEGRPKHRISSPLMENLMQIYDKRMLTTVCGEIIEENAKSDKPERSLVHRSCRLLGSPICSADEDWLRQSCRRDDSYFEAAWRRTQKALEQ